MSQPTVQHATDDGRIRVGDWVRFIVPASSKVAVGVVIYVRPDQGGGFQDIVTDAGIVGAGDVLEVRRADDAPPARKRGGGA